MSPRPRTADALLVSATALLLVAAVVSVVLVCRRGPEQAILPVPPFEHRWEDDIESLATVAENHGQSRTYARTAKEVRARHRGDPFALMKIAAGEASNYSNFFSDKLAREGPLREALRQGEFWELDLTALDMRVCCEAGDALQKLGRRHDAFAKYRQAAAYPIDQRPFSRTLRHELRQLHVRAAVGALKTGTPEETGELILMPSAMKTITGRVPDKARFLRIRSKLTREEQQGLVYLSRLLKILIEEDPDRKDHARTLLDYVCGA